MIQEGLNCSPFAAEPVLGVVHEVYLPFLALAISTAPPGKVTLLAVSVFPLPAGVPIPPGADQLSQEKSYTPPTLLVADGV